MLPEEQRDRLLAAIAETIGRSGGEVVIPHHTLLVMGHARFAGPGAG
jgi:hypothetical protein